MIFLELDEYKKDLKSLTKKYRSLPEEGKIIFVELYHKNNKENEDRGRILANFS